jgi:hypothetical protein
VNISLAPQKLSPFTYSATILLNISSRASKPPLFFVGSFVGRRGSQNPHVID